MSARPSPDCRAAMTAILAGEAATTPDTFRRARVHAARCPGCASVLDDPDAADTVLAALEPHRSGFGPALRAALGVVCSLQLALALPWLVGANPLGLGHGGVAESHLTRDGALGVVMAVLGLLVSWRPRYAMPALALAVVVFAAQVAGGLADGHASRVDLAFEAVHGIVVAIIALVAWAARPWPAAPPVERRRPLPVRTR